MRNIQMLLNISNIILDSESRENALSEVVSYLAKALDSDVCSIYHLSKIAKNTLTLAATEGLSQEAVGRVTMEIGEGLTGLAFSQNKYTFIRNASKHPEFKYFPGIGEEPFDTFIGIPLKRKLYTFGVLVFQFRKNKRNTEQLRKLLQAVAAQVSGLVENQYVMNSIHSDDPDAEYSDGEILVHGVPLSEGVAIGRPVKVISRFVESTHDTFVPAEELQKLEQAFMDTKEDLKKLIMDLDGSYDTDIFHTHLMMLDDSTFRNDVKGHIEQYRKSAAFSVRHVTDKLVHRFMGFTDVYLKERAADIEDICQRLLSHLGVMSRVAELDKDSIVIADRLTPGETASLNLDNVIGFVTEKDGVTSHTAILAKSRQLPAISGVKNIYEITEFADSLIIDGTNGVLIVNPSDERRAHYEVEARKYRRAEERAVKVNPEVVLRNGEGVHFMANVSSLLDVEKARSLCAAGIGLVRTEIFYLKEDGAFSVDKQKIVYTQLMKTAPDGQVVFRLFDIGSDKKSGREGLEENPALGHRGARLLLSRRDLLRDQLKALLEVGAEYPNLKILVPFIAEVQEFLDIKAVIVDVADELGVRIPDIGVMIEIPSIVLMIEEIAQHCDFFSVGTNDLFQYFYAVDRGNPTVSSLYDPAGKPFLKLLENIRERVNRAGKPIEICGEIAADRKVLIKLVAMGFRDFSVNAYSINDLRRYIQRSSL